MHCPSATRSRRIRAHRSLGQAIVSCGLPSLSESERSFLEPGWRLRGIDLPECRQVWMHLSRIKWMVRVEPCGPLVRPLHQSKQLCDVRRAAISLSIDHLDDAPPTVVVFGRKLVSLNCGNSILRVDEIPQNTRTTQAGRFFSALSPFKRQAAGGHELPQLGLVQLPLFAVRVHYRDCLH